MSDTPSSIAGVDVAGLPADVRTQLALQVLRHMTVEEIDAFIEAAQQRRQERVEDHRAQVLEKLRTEAAAAGFSLEDLLPGRRTRRVAGSTVAPKFRGP